MNATEFLLKQHARVHSAKVAEAEAGSFEDLVLGGLNEEQIRLRPRDGLNSLAWLLWHLARTEDVLVNVVIGGRHQVLDQEEWLRRLKVARRDIGTGMTAEEVSDLSARVDIAALRAYRVAVGRRTREIVVGLRPERLEEVVDGSDLRRAVSEGAFEPSAAWVAEAWQGKTRGFLLGSPVVHGALHLGEAMCVRSQAGLGLGR